MAQNGGSTLGQTPWIATPNASFGLALVNQRAKKWVGFHKAEPFSAWIAASAVSQPHNLSISVIGCRGDS